MQAYLESEVARSRSPTTPNETETEWAVALRLCLLFQLELFVALLVNSGSQYLGEPRGSCSKLEHFRLRFIIKDQALALTSQQETKI